MHRRFRQHEIRRVDDLSGVWDFSFLGDVDADSVDVGAIAFDDRMAVPGCFDATPAYAARRGLAAYRTRVLFTDATRHRLVIDGLHHWGRAFLNGQRLGEHVGGFTRFSFDIENPAPGEAELVILADNRFDYERCPLHLDYFDWYHFGGISRGVELHRLGQAWIDAVRIDTTDYRARQVRVQVDYGADRAGQAELAIRCDGREVLREAVTLDAAGGTIERTLTLEGAALWSPEQPSLHLVGVTLGEDDRAERIGIRQVAVRGRQIHINDQPVRLLGFCRHEAHPQFGHTVPDMVQIADVQRLRDMGCNFVRGSHYPQDLRFLDLCDEAGILVWNESIGWQQRAEQLTDEHYLAAQLTQTEEMVAMSRNHACVILWGLLNEADFHVPEVRPGVARLIARIRELDATRPVTYASNHPFDDTCFDLADVISINCYPGWYGGGIDTIAGWIDKIIAQIDGPAGQGGKPMIISEIGAGAVYGWRDQNETYWSEQYQAKHLDTTIRHLFEGTTRICGLSIWQFCDIRTADRVAMGRPRAFNNKGVLDEYRRPKLAYEVVQAHYRRLQ